MPRTASPIVGRWPRRAPRTEFEKSFDNDERYVRWYERTIMHWTNHKIDWFYQEELVLEEKETGKFFWVHTDHLVSVESLAYSMSDYFFKAPDGEEN